MRPAARCHAQLRAYRALIIKQNIARFIQPRRQPIRAALIGVIFDNQRFISHFIISASHAITLFA
mgnify:CR=1 FL=1